MHMVGHQAIARYRQSETLSVSLEEFQIRAAISVHEEHILAIVPALRHVVWNSNSDHSGNSRHDDTLTISLRKGN